MKKTASVVLDYDDESSKVWIDQVTRFPENSISYSVESIKRA